jgi:S-layer homology domain
MRRWPTTMLTLLLISVIFVPVAGGTSHPSTDDADSIFEADINRLAAAGVTSGWNPPTNDNFCPNDNVTRGQMAAFISRALSLPSTSSDYFTDGAGSVFEADINRFAEAGITQGCNPATNDNYCPDDLVTRAQMATFLTRALAYPSSS